MKQIGILWKGGITTLPLVDALGWAVINRQLIVELRRENNQWVMNFCDRSSQFRDRWNVHVTGYYHTTILTAWIYDECESLLPSIRGLVSRFSFTLTLTHAAEQVASFRELVQYTDVGYWQFAPTFQWSIADDWIWYSTTNYCKDAFRKTIESSHIAERTIYVRRIDVRKWLAWMSRARSQPASFPIWFNVWRQWERTTQGRSILSWVFPSLPDVLHELVLEYVLPYGVLWTDLPLPKLTLRECLMAFLYDPSLDNQRRVETFQGSFVEDVNADDRRYRSNSNPSYPILNLSAWDLSSTTSLDYLFYEFRHMKLRLCGLDGWNVSQLRSARYAFDGVDFVDTDLSAWDISNLKDSTKMFERWIHNERVPGVYGVPAWLWTPSGFPRDLWTCSL